MFRLFDPSSIGTAADAAAGKSAPETLPAGEGSDNHVEHPDDGTESATPLFRPEALAERQTQWLGTVLLEPRKPYRTFTLIAACAATAVVGLFFFRDFTRTTRVTGWLVPEAGLVRVFAPRTGIVTKLYVKEGSTVRKGDQLLTLSTEVQSATLGSTQAEVARLLATRRRILTSQRDQIEHLLAQQQRALSSRLEAIRSEQGPLSQEIAQQRERVALARRFETRLRSVERYGIVSKHDLQQSQEARLEQAGHLAGLERQRIAATREQMALEGELNDLPLKAESEIATVDREIAAIDQQLAETEAQREIVLLAPQDGTVTAVLAEPGGHANTAAPLLTIVPAGSRLEAHLYGPSRAVGFLRPGQRVFLRYQAYPYEKFGHYAGTVAGVSGSPLNPAELPFTGAADLSANGSEPLYRITVSLAEQAVTAYGELAPLQPGMRLEADVALDKRRLYEWVLDPLYAIAGRTGP